MHVKRGSHFAFSEEYARGIKAAAQAISRLTLGHQARGSTPPRLISLYTDPKTDKSGLRTMNKNAKCPTRHCSCLGETLGHASR